MVGWEEERNTCVNNIVNTWYQNGMHRSIILLYKMSHCLDQQMKNICLNTSTTPSTTPSTTSSCADESDWEEQDDSVGFPPFNFEEFDRQRQLHESSIRGSNVMTTAVNAPPPPPQIALEYANLEREIRKQREITKQLKQKQVEMEKDFFQELSNLPNNVVETNDLRFSIRTRKKRSRLDSNHMVTCIASYAAHYGCYPKDEPRYSEFVQLHQDLEWIQQQRSQDPTNDTLRRQQLDLNQKKKDMYMFMGMDMVRYIERSRSESLVPFLSRRSRKRRKIK